MDASAGGCSVASVKGAASDAEGARPYRRGKSAVERIGGRTCLVRSWSNVRDQGAPASQSPSVVAVSDGNAPGHSTVMASMIPSIAAVASERYSGSKAA